MNKWLNILLLFALVFGFASVVRAEDRPWSDTCDAQMATLGLPSYYCACKENSHTFAFPMIQEINGITWFDATVNDLRQGISAYWFSNTSVKIEVYAFCSSKEPTFSMTVGANMMCDMDMTKINQKLDEMGEQARLMYETLIPHVRVIPSKTDGSGTVYCYPYDQGPRSKCDNPLRLLPGMVYVSDTTENVYRLQWSDIPSSGKAFIHWKQKNNLPCEIWLTLDGCEGEEIGRVQLSDSLHVYQPDSAKLVDARTKKKSVWLHITHAEKDNRGNILTGRVTWYNNPYCIEEQLAKVTKQTCLGKESKVNMRSYTADTAFIDTLWVTKDTLQTQPVSLTFTQPKMEYDTVLVKEEALVKGYRYGTNTGIVLYQFGDTIVEIKKANTCTRRLQITVEKDDGDAVDLVEAKRGRARKQIINGNVFILVDDRRYNVLGQQIK